MDSDFHKPCRGINGIDLSNYYVAERCHNSIVYVHKKFLPQSKRTPNELPQKRTQHKSQQFDSELNAGVGEINKTIKKNADPILEKTISFAKKLIPLTIPPSTDLRDSTFYTIKTKKSRGKCRQKTNQVNYTNVEANNNRKHFIEMKKDKYKHGKESYSSRDTLNRSSQNNTLEDIDENRSMSCSLSEISERKLDTKRRKKTNNIVHSKLIASESFEAIATDLSNPGNTKIKIHLMNEKDKKILVDDIRKPLLDTIKLLEVDKHKIYTTLENMQNAYNIKKFDLILEKLVCIEKKLDEHILSSQTKSISATVSKVSKLEELEQYTVQDKDSSEEELAEIDFTKRRMRGKSAVIAMRQQSDVTTKIVENVGQGEVPDKFKTGQLGIKPDRPNKVPARFCWTDGGK